MRPKLLVVILIVIIPIWGVSCNNDHAKPEEVDIIISKEVISEDKETNRVEVMISVTNLGDRAVTDIQLKERFTSPHVETIEPQKNFVKIDSSEREPSTEWVNFIPIIDPMQTIKSIYELRVNSPVTLNKTIAIHNDSLVAESNLVNLLGDAETLSAADTRFQNVVVIPVNWSFTFANGDDHELLRHRLTLLGPRYNYSNQELTWATLAEFHDWDSHALFRWYIGYGILGLNNSFIKDGKSGYLQKNGSTSSIHYGSYISPSLYGFDAATVVLTGWYFGFTKDDHEIRAIGIELYDIFYDPELGKINWTTQARFADKNHDDDYIWSYSWLIIALKNGAVRNAVESTGKSTNAGFGIGGIEVKKSGYKNFALLPQGWGFVDSKGGDHQIARHSFEIRYHDFGQVKDWVVWLIFRDKNGGEPYNWYTRVAQISFNDGAYVVMPDLVSHIDDEWGRFDYTVHTNAIFPRTYTGARSHQIQ